MGKKITTLLMVLLIMIMPLKVVQASSLQTIDLGSLVAGEITENEEGDSYKIVLSKAGKVTLNISSEIYSVDAQLVDVDGNKVINDDIYYGSENSPKTYVKSADLEAGTYYINMNKNYGNIGKYSIKVDFKTVNNNDIEPNNGTDIAQSLTLNANPITGYISWNDEVDVYKVQLQKAGKLSLNISSEIYSVDARLFDAEGNEIINDEVYYGSEANPKVYNKSVDLEPGTYYVKMDKNYGYTGKYTIKATFKVANNNDIEPNNGTDIAQNLTLNTSPITGYISWNDEVDVYKVQLQKAGKLSLNISSEIYSADLQLLDADGSKIIYDEIYYGSEINPKVYNKSVDLEPGIYYVKMNKNYGYTGKYTIKADLKLANNNDIEPNNGINIAQKLTLNANPLTGYISWSDEVDIYKIELLKAGKVSLNVLSQIYSADVELLDAEGNKIISDEVYYGSEENQKVYNKYIDLEKGTYYVRINKRYGYTGKYTLKVGFTAANNNEVESNNGTNIAQKLTVNTTPITGYISWNDEVDIYKIQLQKTGKINLGIISQIYSVDVELLDANGNRIEIDEIYYGDEKNPKIFNKSIELKAGTYYIKISRRYGYTGKYTIKVTTQQGWVSEGGKWYYYDLTTGAKKTGWLNLSGKWYFLDSNGVMKTGWLSTGGKWYYLEASGVMKTGWLNLGGNWYFLESSGAMKTGWLLTGGKWYYLYDSGVMARNTVIGGCRLGSDGAWIQ